MPLDGFDAREMHREMLGQYQDGLDGDRDAPDRVAYRVLLSHLALESHRAQERTVEEFKRALEVDGILPVDFGMLPQ